MAHLAHYREAHPMPFVITHWINLVCMILLIVTGFSIHFPFWPAFMGIARGVHVFCGFVLFMKHAMNSYAAKREEKAALKARAAEAQARAEAGKGGDQ